MSYNTLKDVENACMEAIKQGDTSAYSMLGVVLAEQGKPKEAEEAFRKAISLGLKEAHNNLGILLAEQKGREAEAELSLLEAIKQGFDGAYYNLGKLLEGQPGREMEAEAAFRNAIKIGFNDALIHLGVLLSEQDGRESDAEQAFREALELGHIAAPSLLGTLLANQPRRRDEGYKLLRRARNAGDAAAAEMLRRFSEKQVAHFLKRLETPDEIYKACKEIDGDLRRGTHILAGARVMGFYNLLNRQPFYEPISSHEELFKVSMMNADLWSAHMPTHSLSRLLVAFRMFNSAYAAPLGRLPLPLPSDIEKESHCVFLTGVDSSDGALEFVNSWGAGWGDKGFGWLSQEYLRRYMADAWLHRNIRYGPTRHNFSSFTRAANNAEKFRAWELENRRRQISRFRAGGNNYRILAYETISFIDECPVRVIEVRDGVGTRIGWAHLHHLAQGAPRTSVLKEFFIWPCYRRLGIGTRLENVAASLSSQMGSSKLQILFHQLDSWPPGKDWLPVRTAGREFGKKAGYEWKWRTATCPNLTAVGEKKL